ncbi:hypothetical protein XENOCAPTIV_026692, partial [Xenoophorus captivus]
MNRVKPPSRTCTCDNLISGADIHSVCPSCLGLQDVRDALALTLHNRHNLKSHRHRLTHQASLSEVDPVMGVANSPPPELTATDEGEATLARTSWGDQLNAVAPLSDPEEDEAILPVFSTFANAKSESEVEPISLGSDDDKQDCEPYVIPLSAKPLVMGDTSHNGSPNMTAAALAPVEPLLASHIHPSQKSTMTAARPTLPFKADSFQSALNKKIYKVVTASVKALNASSLLLAYQAGA